MVVAVLVVVVVMVLVVVVLGDDHKAVFDGMTIDH